MRPLNLIVLMMAFFLCVLAVQADWGPTKRLTWTEGTSTQPAIAADSSGNLHLAWVNFTPGNAELYYKKSTDGGAAWSANKRLTWTSSDSLRPDVAVDSSGNPHVVWEESLTGSSEIFYRRSTDKGLTWSAAQRLTWNSGYSNLPDLAIDPSGNLHVVWHDDTPGIAELYCKKSPDGGASWSPNKRLTYNAGASYVPSLIADSLGGLHLAWNDSTPGNFEIYYKKSPNGGASWSSNKRLTWNSGSSSYPVIGAESSSLLHVVWSDATPGNRETFYKKSTDGGAVWSSVRRLTWNSGDTWDLGFVAGPSENLHAIWIDTTPGNREVYYKGSTNGGATWSSLKRLSWSAHETYNLAMAADPSGNVHVVWEDGTIGDIDIYYRKGDSPGSALE